MESLIDCATAYKKFYQIEQKSLFHTTCSCITSQQVSFNVGRTIRKQLYDLCGVPLTRESILNADLTQIKNLTPNRIKLLKDMAKIDDNESNDKVLTNYYKLKGFGKWTHNAISILLGLSDTVNLSTDLYIRKNLAIYLSKPKLTEKEAYDYLLQANNNQTIVCHFLWRIKPTSVHKVITELVLTKDDFV